MVKSAPIKDTLQGLYQQITQAAQEGMAQIERLDKELSSRVDERNRLNYAPLTKADFIDQFRKKVHRAGESHASLLSHEVHKLERSKHYARRSDAGIDFLLCGRGIGNQQVSQIALCYFFEDAIVAGLERSVSDLDWPEEGAITLEAITQRLKVLEGEIDDLEMERSCYLEVLQSYKIVDGVAP